MPHRRFLFQLCALSQVLGHWRLWRRIMAAAVVCLMSEPLSRAQEPGPADKPAATKVQPATEPQARDRDKLIAEHQRLLGEETKHAEAGKYAEAIKTSHQRESVLLDLAKFPDLKAVANQIRREMLLVRGDWQWLIGQISDAIQTFEQWLQLIEAEFGPKSWQSASARFRLDYYRKFAAIDEPTRIRMRKLAGEVDAASAKGNYREAIVKTDALKDIEAKVFGVEHPGYADSLTNIAGLCLQARDYERATQEWLAALTIRRKAYGDAHPDVLACHDGLAAVARQQRHWDAAHAHYDRAAAQRRQLLGTISPDDPAVWLDDFAVDSRAQYIVTGDVRWEAGQITLSPEATIGRTIEMGSAWEVRFDLTFPPAEAAAKSAMSRFEFTTMTEAPSTYAVVWKTEHQDGKLHTRLQFVEITPKPAGLAGLFADEKVKVLREADWPHDPSGLWSLRWHCGLLQVQHGTQRAFAGYVDTSSDSCSAWVLRSSVASQGVAQLKLQGTSQPVLFSAEAAGQFTQARQDHETTLRLRREGKFAEAAKLAEGVVETTRALLGEDHPDTATNINNLAVLYMSQGNYAAAELHCKRALKINEKALGPDHPDTANSLNNLAELYRVQSNYAAAEPLYLRALKIWEKAIGPPDHPKTAMSLNGLALLYQSQGNYAAAEPLYQRALKINETELGPDHPDTATSLNNLAFLCDAQKNYAAAEPLYLRALKINEKVLSPDHPDTAAILHNLAALYQSQKNYANAEQYYQRALKIKEYALGPDHPGTATSVSALALFRWEGNQAEGAVSLAERAMGMRLRHLDETAAIQTEQQQFLMSRDTDGNVGFWLTVSAAEPKWTSAVYRDVLAWKGLITARQQGLRLALKDDPLFAEFRQVTQQLSTVSLSPPLPPSDPQSLAAWKTRELELRRNWESQKAALEVEHERLEKELAVKSVAFRESLEQRRVRPEDLVNTLKAQDRPTALVDLLEYRYFARKNKDEKGERRIVAFIVRGDRPVARVELGSADAIVEQVAQWRVSFGLKTADRDLGAELRQRVWQPLEPHLQGIETVLISPDGPLAQLPWGALPGAKPGTYLLEDLALAVIPVPQMLPALLGKARRVGPPESLLLAGDIEYGGDLGHPQDPLAKHDAVGRLHEGRLMKFPNLDAAQRELNSIKVCYENAEGTGTVQTMQKQQATEAAFREQATTHQWLHVITHGFFAPPVDIGAEFYVMDGKTVVKELVSDGSAMKHGRLKPGDVVQAVAQGEDEFVELIGLPLDSVMNVMKKVRGNAGTKVRLKVLAQGQGAPVVYEIMRSPNAAQATASSNSEIPLPGLLSGLAFAGANGPPEPEQDDGILTAMEIAALDLNQVDTVVLSACETGLGEVAGGEGLLGLQRAFQITGAKTCVASLWSVNDAGTRVLMERFYDNLWGKKMGKLAALREAQRWALRNPAEFYAKLTEDEKRVATKVRGLATNEATLPTDNPGLPPFYWAAFVLSGDWR